MATTSANAFIDTNVLLRANIVGAPFHGEALQLLNLLWDEEVELWISRQVLREYIANVTRPQAFMEPMTTKRVVERIGQFQTLFRVANDTEQVTSELLLLLAEFPTGGKQIHDANIVATMVTYQIDTLVTQNTEDFKRFSGRIKIIPLVAS
jgi:predicted nucleic acid-binding protein